MEENKIFERLCGLIENYRSTERSGKFLDYHSPEDLRRILACEKEENLGDWEEIFHWLEKYLDYSVKTNHHSFVNRMWVGANLPSLVGEIVTILTNSSACTFESAPVSTIFEQYMIAKMLDLVGFTNGEGQMTTGSSNANMIAMMAARNITLKNVKKAGLFGQQKLFAFVSADAHFSMDKAANVLGIGSDQLIKVPVNSRGELEVKDLERGLERVVASDGCPFFVGATAGTTVRGAYDPIMEILKLRKKFPFWLHIDGAWGGATVLSEGLRHKYLPGISEVDSFTYDFHKMLGASLMCNCLLINNRSHTLGSVLSAGDGSYLFRDDPSNEVQDLGAVSLQCGRRIDSLKWFLDWKYFGRAGLAKRVEGFLELCKYAEELVVASNELELVVPRTSFNVCFRYKVADGDSDTFNNALRTQLYHKGISLVGVAYIEGRVTLRFLITNPQAKRADIESYFNRLLAEAKELLGGGS